MAKILNEEEKKTYINNRNELHNQLAELQADLEDMTDEEIINCRSSLLQRINLCMVAILETDEDNI